MIIELRTSNKFESTRFKENNPLINIMQNFDEKIIMNSLPFVWSEYFRNILKISDFSESVTHNPNYYNFISS